MRFPLLNNYLSTRIETFIFSKKSARLNFPVTINRSIVDYDDCFGKRKIAMTSREDWKGWIQSLRGLLKTIYYDASKCILNPSLRKHSAEIDKLFSELRETYRGASTSAVSKKCLPASEDDARSFLNQRWCLVDHTHRCYKHAKQVLGKIHAQGSAQATDYEKMLTELNKVETIVALERGILARDTARIALRLSAGSKRKTIGPAYVRALADRFEVLPDPINLPWKGLGSDRANFNNKVKRAYNDPVSNPKERPSV